MNKIESYGLDRLKHRVERLQRLLSLEAPALIANEIAMIVDAMKMYSPEAWYKAQQHFEMRALKFSCGFCSQDGCDEHRDHDAKELSDMCRKHITEFESKVDEYTDVSDIDDEELSS